MERILCHKNGNLNEFIEFMIIAIDEALDNILLSIGEKSKNIPGFHACVEQIGNASTGSYIRYKITTFIEFGPILGQHFEIPIKSQTEKIYVFSN